MHLLEPLALFLAESTVTDTSSSSNLPKPLSRFLAAGNGAYGPPKWERVGEVTNKVRDGAAAYSPPMLEKLGEVANNVRHGAAAPVWEKAEEAAQWSAANPVPAACAVVGVGGIIAVAAPGIVSAPILSSAGFGATGVQAGSAAAAIHSTIGNVGANSLFGLFQSAGASASGLAVVNGVVQVGGAVAVGASGGVAWVKSMF